ncbi:MAG: SPOR domain-containing protein [Alphaproteobacteria bacterium]
MSQDNQFYQRGYDHYLKAPRRQDGGEGSAVSGKTRIMRKLKSPAVATVALLGAGAIFIAVIYATYPSGDGVQQPVPIIKADLTPIKEMPQERGGMSIPQRENTILAQVGQPPSSIPSENIENLLANTPEELVSKEQALEEAMKHHPMMPDNVDLQSSPDVGGEQVIVLSSQDGGVVDEPFQIKEPEVLVPLKEPALVEPDPSDVLQKIGAADSDDKEIGEFAKMTANAAIERKPNAPPSLVAKRPSEMHAAAQSPETIDFVRSVLNSKAEGISQIEPASGISSAPAKVAIAPGDYFVQLASITDAARAGSEWSKMKAKYSALSSSNFRVQEASLSSGTFFRIQAGPMSKSSAEEICESLKKSGKPGGCLVVK